MKTHKWYLHNFDAAERTSLSGSTLLRLPVLWCIDMTDGNGDFVSPSVEIELATGRYTGISGVLAGVGQYEWDILKITLGVTVSTPVKFTGVI